MRAFNAVVSKKIPQFIRDDYPALNEFIEAYYEYLTTQHIDKTDFKRVRDIDDTLDEFLAYFKNTLAKGIPDSSAADFKTVIKNIREMFKSKGAEKSLKFFFKAFFGEDADVFYPRTQMFIPSDATWLQPRIIKLAATPGVTADDLKGVELTFTNGKLFVHECVVNEGVFVLSVYDVFGNAELVSEVFLGNTALPIVKQVIGFSITNPGSAFEVNSQHELLNGVRVLVKEITRGPVTSITVIDGGDGYDGTEPVLFAENGPLGKTQGRGASAEIESVDGFGTVESIKVLRSGSLYDKPPAVIIESTSGTDGIFRAVGNFGKLKTLSIIDGGYNLPATPYADSVGDATVEVIFGNVVTADGNFQDTTGFVSTSNAYLQDEHYYQFFSYLIRVGVNIDQYGRFVKDILHPAGMKMFSSFTIESFVEKLSQLENTELILHIVGETVGLPAAPQGSVFELFIDEYVLASPLRISDIDLRKFEWFSHSTPINRVKDFTIESLSLSPLINAGYNNRTSWQPDAVVSIVNAVPVTGFGNTLGNLVPGEIVPGA